jgi:hypothetical protein
MPYQYRCIELTPFDSETASAIRAWFYELKHAHNRKRRRALSAVALAYAYAPIVAIVIRLIACRWPN